MTENQSTHNEQQNSNDPTALTGVASQGTTDSGMDPDTAASESVIVAGGGSGGGNGGGNGGGGATDTSGKGEPTASAGEGG